MDSPMRTTESPGSTSHVWIVRDPENRIIGAAPDRWVFANGERVTDGAFRAVDQAFGEHSTCDASVVLRSLVDAAYHTRYDSHGYQVYLAQVAP